MNKSSRTLNSVRNTLMGITNQIIVLLLSFVTRTVFIHYLGIEYLGVNGLFINILNILSLAELGIGSAIIYSMYKPLADKDTKTISALMNFYAKVYMFIGLFIGLIGLSLIPFLDLIIGNQTIDENLVIIYLLFLFNTIVSYFFIYKRSIIEADQKQYIISKFQLYFNIIKYLFQIIVIIYTQNFIFYLIVQTLTTFCENLFISKKADKMYPFLRKYKKERLNIEEKKSIWKNIKALMIYKVSGTLLDGTDNIIISVYVGIVWVGKLSNYTLLLGALSSFAGQFTQGIIASVGNFIAKESKEKQEFLLRVITLGHFFIFGFSFIFLYLFLNPFIELWIGDEYVLNNETVFVLSFNWYIMGMLSSMWIFRSTMGLFVYGKYRPLITAVINIIASIYLAKFMGITGVLLGTTIARVTTNVWFDPLIIYRYGLEKSVKNYYYTGLKYLLVVLINMGVLSFLLQNISGENYIIFIVKILISIIVVTFSFWVIFSRTEEFKYLVKTIKEILIKRVKTN